MQGASNVLVSGVPMPNISDPAEWLLKKLAGRRARLKASRSKRIGGGGGCGK
jgi:hypothetical protein